MTLVTYVLDNYANEVKNKTIAIYAMRKLGLFSQTYVVSVVAPLMHKIYKTC